ncbi:MAG: hypothetical protein AABX38_05595 [Candidatus Micrarchaeota archaeon]
MKNTRKITKEKCYKGQYFSFDAIIATVIFVIALVSLLSYWNATKNSFELQSNELSQEAFRVSNVLLSPGYPANSVCSSQSQVGFGKSISDKVLMLSKIECVRSLASDTVKRSLSTGFGVSVYMDDKLVSGEDLATGAISSRYSNIERVRRVVSVLDDFYPASPFYNTANVSAIDIYVYR